MKPICLTYIQKQFSCFGTVSYFQPNCYLSYFTRKISLPLLYVVEICNQGELCNIFPQLYNDLLNGSMEKLSEYIVNYKHLEIQEPSADS